MLPADAWPPTRAGCFHVIAEEMGSKSFTLSHNRLGCLAKSTAFSMSCCPQRNGPLTSVVLNLPSAVTLYNCNFATVMNIISDMQYF